MLLDREIETYNRELPNLEDKEGKFVIIHEDQIIDIFDTYDDALKVGYARFGLKPFMVQEIHAVEHVQFVTRDLDFECPT